MNNRQRVPRLEIDLRKIATNARAMFAFCHSKGVELTAVTKGACGSPAVAAAFLGAGIQSLGDSRLSNLQRLRAAGVTGELVLIRSPMLSEAALAVAVADTSLNSELSVIERLNEEASILGITHQVILMVEWGDLREGVLVDELGPMVEAILKLRHIRLQGLGANLACLSGCPPSSKRMDQLSELALAVQNRFGIRLGRVSGGNSSNYQWMRTAPFLGMINHVRMGESLLLGCDSISHKSLRGFETGAFRLVGEVIELKDKPAGGKTIRRAILALGHQDLDIAAITAPGLPILGATSDHLVVDASGTDLRVGEEVAFSMGYSALMTAMASPFVAKHYLPERSA